MDMFTIIITAIAGILFGLISGFFIARKNVSKEMEGQLLRERELLKAEFKATAGELMEEKRESLSSANREQLNPLVQQLREQLEKVEKQLARTREDGARDNARMEQIIKEMASRTVEVGKGADALAQALRGNNKMQGNYGEVVLADILRNAGLVEGEDFHTQELIRDNSGNAIKHSESGRKLIPDVIVNLPDNRQIVVDSKVSLSAYVDWCNAEDQASKEDARRRHIESITRHVEELQGKEYHKYLKSSGVQGIDYSIMFIPNEGAFQLYLENDAALWHTAYEKGVIITGRLTLFSMLRMIMVVWRQVKQERNMEEIIRNSSILLNRIAEFNTQMENIGKALQQADAAYQSACKKMVTGKQSIAVSVRKLQELGAKADPGKRLPESQE
ncbi:MAG: DNA recombination protein RmuC [Bacteroidales bacterium]|nr:DNA recombination protein RmuC [Bacteroidales bacterium]